MKADQINTANQTKLQLIDEAESNITLFDRKVRLGMATNSVKKPRYGPGKCTA